MKKPLHILMTLVLSAALLAGCNFPGQSPAAAPTQAFPTESGQSAQPTDAEPTDAPAPAEPTGEPAAGVEPTQAPAAAPEDNPGFPVKVIKPDGTSAEIFSKALRDLEKNEIRADGKIYRGVKLSSLIAWAGIANYKQATVIGEDGTSFTLPKAQINNNVVLYFTPKDTIQLIGTAIPKQNWVKLINQVKIE